MSDSLFVAMSDTRMAYFISRSRDRVALATPGIGLKTADALVSAAKRIGHDRVFVVTDCDEEVFRLGYGDIEALSTLRESGQTVGQSSGLRIGVLVCDDRAWSFAPTALYVESEVHSDETPNAISFRGEDVDRVLARIVPKTFRQEVVTPDNTPPLLRAMKESMSGMLPSAERLDRDLLRSACRVFKSAFDVHCLEHSEEPFRLNNLLELLATHFGRSNLIAVRPYVESGWERLRSRFGERIAPADFDSAFEALEQTAEPEQFLTPEVETAEVEVGSEPVSNELLTTTQDALAQAPPIPFDVARQVRVFEPYIQYVEINLKGCHIERRTVELPKAMQGLDPSADLSSRLHTTFDLIEKTSGVSSAQMEAEVKELREQTKSLGKPWGRVLLRSTRTQFDQQVSEIRRKLDEHKAKVRDELTAVLEDSRNRLVKHFLPLVRASPPPKLLSQITNNPPTENQIEMWLNMELDRTFPKEEDLMSEMSLDVQFRDVTYETLKQEGFAEKLRQAYPMVDWDKPFTEFDAAKERDE